MIVEIAHGDWNEPAGGGTDRRALDALEAGAVVHLPRLAFSIPSSEQRLFSIGLSGAAKNVSFDPVSDLVSNADASGGDAELLHAVLARFSASATRLVGALFPAYQSTIRAGRASYRPAEISGRRTSWRKDDTRLHVDSFPASPTGGRRILRVFTNINPHGLARTWRVGGPFSEIAQRYRAHLTTPWPGTSAVLHALRFTKTRRTIYDALMLQLHDLMKRDEDYQASDRHSTIAFEPGATWIAFTDEVTHAALSGQYQLEQTMLLPVEAMDHPERSPLRILERELKRQLV